MEDVSSNENNNRELRDFEEEISTLTRVEKISVFIEQLKNSNYNIRLFCVKQLTLVGELLGQVRTDDELIPLIIDILINFEDNEEVLVEISNQLIKLFQLFPTKTMNLSNILKGLELLAGNDDEIVRQQATDNMCELIKSLDEDIIKNEIFPLMQRLIQNDIKSKVSCCYLFPVVYPSLNDYQIKRELIQAYHEISKEDSPSVRRAAAHNIKNFALIDDEDLIKDLVNIHSELMRDSIDIVKVFTIGSTKNLLKNLSSGEKIPLIKNFNSLVNKDNSWRVKYAAAESISEICPLFDQTFNDQNFLPLLMLFLKDPEPEVRSAIISKIHQILPHISMQKFINSILPIFKDSISSDNNHHVRSIFADTIIKCSKFVDDNTFQQWFYPCINKMLKDEIIEVRHAAMENLELLEKFFKNEKIMLDLILPSFLELSKDLKWRIRLTLAEKLNILVDVCTSDTYISYFLPIVNNFFTDNASQIREVSVQIYKKLIRKTNNSNNIVPNVWILQENTLNSSNYILRISSLNSIDYLKESYEENFLYETVIPSLILISNDKVPNVKFSFCNVIKSLFEYIYNKSNFNKTKFKPLLQELLKILKNIELENMDVDVKFFASKATSVLNSFSYY